MEHMDDIKQAVKNFRAGLTFAALILIAAGVIFLAFPESCSHIIAYIIGIVCLIGGISSIVSYFKIQWKTPFSSFGFVQGTALAIVGIFILINPEFLIGFLTSILGIVLIVDGVLKLQYAIDLLRIKLSGWVFILILAIVSAILGILTLYNPFATANALMIFIGVSLLVDGAADLGTIVYVGIGVKRLKKKINDAAAIDAEITEDD